MKKLRIDLNGKTKEDIHQKILEKQRESYDEIIKHNILVNQSGDKYSISFNGPVMGISFVLNGIIEVFDGYIIVQYEHNMESSFVDNAIERLAKKELEKRMN